MTVEQLRKRLARLQSDERLTQCEREEIRIRTIGVLNVKPRTVGDAKRLVEALETALDRVTTEIPW